MPIKREDGFTKPRRTKAISTSKAHAGKRKRSATHTDNDTDLIKALKENNTSLATALDESKKSYRGLQEDFLLLQSERQELLERVFSLESQLCDQQKLVAEQLRPIFKLLNQTEKSLLGARHSLATVLTGCYSSRIWSPSLSPIHNSTRLLDIKPHSPLPQPTADIKHKYDTNRAKIFPKTPHPIVAISSPNEKSVHGMSIFEPKLFDFSYSASQQADTPLPKSVEPGDLLQSKAAASLVSIEEKDILNLSKHKIGSESLVCDTSSSTAIVGDRPKPACPSLSLTNPPRKKITVREGRKIATRKEKKNEKTTARPRRTCSTVNISYQEPNLKSKLTFDENANSVKVYDESSVISTRSKVKNALQDVTNKV